MSFENSRGQNYPRIAYKWWYALAEFIDNSTQNYFDNKEELDKELEKSGESFTVSITRGEKKLRVADNAFGMDMKILQRAMNVSTPPPIPKGKKTLGRSRYGVGMKTASGWAGRYLEIRTTMLGSGEEITVKLDWDKVNDGELDLELSTRKVSKKEHGTTIEINGLYDPPKGRTVTKIVQYLRSIYRMDIRDKDMVLNWDSKPLEPFTFEGSTDFQLKPNNTPWSKKITKKVGGRDVKGWFGVLRKGKAARSKAGFSIFHNNRMIEGWPNAWRPYQIFGDDSNNLINQRLVGEIHLDQFGISHTKDGIYWRTGEEEKVGTMLKQELDDLIEQAKIPYKNQGAGSKEQKKTFEKAAQDLETEIKDIENHLQKEISLVEVEPPVTKNEQDEINATIVNQAANKGSAEWRINLSQYSVELYLENNGIDKPYYVNSISDEKNTTVFVVVNLDHPFYEGNDLETANLNLRHAVMDAISEYTAGRIDRSDHTLVNYMKDRFLRLEWKAEQNQPT